MSYFKIFFAIVGLVTQLLKYMGAADKSVGKNTAGNILDKIERLRMFNSAFKKAEKGDGKELEEMFTIMRPRNTD